MTDFHIVVGENRARIAFTIAFMVIGAQAADDASAEIARKDTLEATAYYEDVAEYVARLGVEREKDSERTCKNNAYANNPCRGIARLWRAFAEKHGLEANYDSARMFQAYIQGDFARGDRLYAEAKGYEYSIHGDYYGVGLEVAALGLKPETDSEKACKNNYFSSNPCRGVKKAWEAFAAKHGLELDRQSADMFQAYVQGEFRVGDHLYAAATGRTVYYEPEPHSGIGDEIAALGLKPERDTEKFCTNNPYAINPCPSIARVFQEFAEKHGLEMSRENADILVAYAVGDFTKGDRLFAAAKDITVTVLLEIRNVEIPRAKAEPPRLSVPIRPSQL